MTMQPNKELPSKDFEADIVAVEDGGRIYRINRSWSELFDPSVIFGAEASILSQESLSPSVGRAQVRLVSLSATEQCVVRGYFRGGFARHFSTRYFARNPMVSWDTTRPFSEFSILLHLFGRGVKVPEPIAAMAEPAWMGFVYGGAIVTRLLPAARNFLEMISSLGSDSDVLQQKEVLLNTVYRAGQVAKQSLDLGIQHRDLHLGNVLLSGDDVYLIDFDKAKRCSSGERSAAVSSIRRRWNKSVAKHHQRISPISEELCENFLCGLQGGLKPT